LRYVGGGATRFTPIKRGGGNSGEGKLEPLGEKKACGKAEKTGKIALGGGPRLKIEKEGDVAEEGGVVIPRRKKGIPTYKIFERRKKKVRRPPVGGGGKNESSGRGDVTYPETGLIKKKKKGGVYSTS